jgi:SAM-dependent methyltransferase
MTSTNDSSVSDPKALVERGYDAIAPEYLSWVTTHTSPQSKYFAKLLALLPPATASSPPPRILELGCGAGVPSTRTFVQRGYRVVANDISTAQIELARKHTSREGYLEGASDADRAAAVAPEAWQEPELRKVDMMGLTLEDGSVDAVAAFHSIIHLPRDEQGEMLKRAFRWMRPGGHLLVNMCDQEMKEHVMPGWLGADMYWSSYDAKKNLEFVREAGFELIETSVEHEFEEKDTETKFLWILAKKN